MPRPFRLVAVLLLALRLSNGLHAQPAAQSLAGEWRFALDRADTGVNEAWFNRDLPDRIMLPGVLPGQPRGPGLTLHPRSEVARETQAVVVISRLRFIQWRTGNDLTHGRIPPADRHHR